MELGTRTNRPTPSLRGRFSRAAPFVVLTLAITVPAVAGAAPAPLLDCSGLPGVMVSVGAAKPIKLAIDTGNNNSFFDNDTARALGLMLEPVQDSGGRPVPGIAKAKVTHVVLGDAALGDLTVLVGDLKADRRSV